MFFISESFATPPSRFQTPLQQKVYEALAVLQIPYERVETDEVITMEDCVGINEKLQMKMVKTLFLCIRHEAAFYLYITTGDKAFRSKAFSAALEVPRVSFAPAERMEQILGIKIGAATVFSALLETARDVRIVFDKDVLAQPWYGCSDGTTTGYLKLPTQQILNVLLPYARRDFTVIQA